MHPSQERHIDQAAVRAPRIFTDQHGRKWYGEVEIGNGHSRGYPISLRPHQWRAPVLPPPAYLKVRDPASGELHIDYEGWRRHRVIRHREYQAMMQEQARRMYKDRASEAIEKQDDALMFAVGPAPAAVQQIDACMKGHPYALGFDQRRPKALEAFFPDTEHEQIAEFPTWEEEQADQEPTATVEWPKKEFGGRYVASDGTGFTGTGAKARAEEYQAALTVGV